MGRLDLDRAAMLPAGNAQIGVAVDSAAPGSPSDDALRLLANWANWANRAADVKNLTSSVS